MKKKRKKNQVLASTSIRCTSGARHWILKPHSAPDVPYIKNNSSGDELRPCFLFFDNLLSSKVIDCDVIMRSFVRQLTDKLTVKWTTLQVKDVLYVEVPLNISKETFIALLDHAEEDLGVAQVIACIDERRTTRDSLIKAFKFMGFENIHPVELRSTYNVKQNSHFICLGYELDWNISEIQTLSGKANFGRTIYFTTQFVFCILFFQVFKIKFFFLIIVQCPITRLITNATKVK